MGSTQRLHYTLYANPVREYQRKGSGQRPPPLAGMTSGSQVIPPEAHGFPPLLFGVSMALLLTAMLIGILLSATFIRH